MIQKKKIKEDLDTSFLPSDNMDFGCAFENVFNVLIQKSIYRNIIWDFWG